MPKSPAQARAFEETARPGHRLIDPSASAAIRKDSSQTAESSLQLLADSPVQVGQVLDSGSLLRVGARDGTLRLPVVDKDFHVREHERELTREYSVQEDVCYAGVQCQRRVHHTVANTRRRTLEMRSKDRPWLQHLQAVSQRTWYKCDQGGRPAYRLQAKLEQVFDHAAKQASSVIRLGPFAELVDDQQRARSAVSEREAVVGEMSNKLTVPPSIREEGGLLTKSAASRS